MLEEGRSMTTNYRDVCAGIVLYNPDLYRLKLSIASISKQVGHLVLIDNGSNDKIAIERLAEESVDSTLIRLDENKGIAYALNRICEYSESHQYKWAFTLDHDTVCPSDIIEKLMMHADIETSGIVCPSVYYEGLGVDTRERSLAEVEDVKACMTSASLTNLKAWREVGGFNESYFIDYVDNDICMKLKLLGYSIKRVNSCAIHHQLGNTRTLNLLGKKLVGTTHSPIRCYYIMRNNILFIKEYKPHLPLLKEASKVIYIAYKEFLFSETKGQTLSMLIKGIGDGLKGRSGKYNG